MAGISRRFDSLPHPKAGAKGEELRGKARDKKYRSPHWPFWAYPKNDCIASPGSSAEPLVDDEVPPHPLISSKTAALAAAPIMRRPFTTEIRAGIRLPCSSRAATAAWFQLT